ncbi:MarR family transcriptional regulator [Streptomyces sp. SID13031]|uniref:MarR family winged helix-turn-helix transcriptional regulator n=1 Tax=Streptomyces sp. SID13031 TaxID=2706046 RepID=UPI0013CC41DB|nr:MarR family transcriptional regulator [Streptomyces sp. SID13031]NEA36209.1 MarR family transcriptional regulator [Streptomyces sp. SID13031]
MATTKARHTELVGSLVGLMHVLQDLYAETSRPLGLTPQQAHLLCVLLGGPQGMTDLSRIMSIERSSLTSMVDRLERRSLLARNPHPTDRRACQITLTTDGHTLADQAHTAFTDRVEALTVSLSPTARKTLVSAITNITEPGQ